MVCGATVVVEWATNIFSGLWLMIHAPSDFISMT